MNQNFTKNASTVSLNIPEGQKHIVYQYPYMLEMKDKIFYAVGDDELRKEIFEKINSSFEKDYSDSLAGEIALEHLLTDESLSFKIKNLLISRLNYVSNNLARDIAIKLPESGQNDIWLNRMKSNEYNPSHYHAGFLSWIWYIDIPEEIRQESQQHKTMGLVEFKSSRSNDIMRFNPSTNDFFMFNSDHMHTVYPFRSNLTRISLAGNIYAIDYGERVGNFG